MQDYTQHPLWERQVRLEEDMRNLGIERFRDQVRKNNERGTATKAGASRRLLPVAVQALEAAIQEFVDLAGSGVAGRRHASVKYIKRLEADTIALLTCRAVIDSLAIEPNIQRVAYEVGKAVENEVNARLFREAMPQAYKKFHKRATQENLQNRMWGHLLRPAEFIEAPQEEWPRRDIILLGLKLLDLFKSSTGMIERVNVHRRGKTISTLKPTPETIEWLLKENERMEWLSPVMLPTIIPPRPWSTPFDGGYHTTHVRERPLVKVQGNRDHLKLLQLADMPEVYRSVNLLQDTAWKINTQVLDVMEHLFEIGSEVGEIPRHSSLSFPEKPDFLVSRKPKQEWTQEEHAASAAWRGAMHQVHQSNAQLEGKRHHFLRMLWVARKFRDYEEIFFPHQLDWRGRAYPMPLYLHPQGNDMQRGLLTFASTVPISDEEDESWLAIHGAGLWGVDKVSLEERHQWIKDHSEEIEAAGRDPYENRFWSTAEKPWSALAFCLEWSAYREQGFGYESTLPIQMDGTCNGLQNFSAMLRDRTGGAAVNLIKADKPQDIYQVVADVVSKQVERDLLHEDEQVRLIANGWHGKVTRKVTKRPVMTLAYGASRFGFVQQVEEDTLKPWRHSSDQTYPFVERTDEGGDIDISTKAAQYMGYAIWDAVGSVVVAAASAMDWLQRAAKEARDLNRGFYWTTPTGFIALQAYKKDLVRRIDTTFDKARYNIQYRDYSDEIDTRKQSSGVSPNWVHSLDASHLVKTIAGCGDLGMQSFSMIHDSYGTHAGNAWAMAKVLREKFVEMYRPDVLAGFKREVESQIGKPLPDLPPMGDLDLDDVLDSPFFFA